MIINTGMRTDIPAFYPLWLANRLREGFALARSPYSPETLYRYSLNPEIADIIAFCTKNPIPMLPYMSLLEPYGQFWYVTITPYGRDIEPNVPCKKDIIKAFRELFLILGKNKKRIGWRYDPVIITDKYTEEVHKESFAEMSAALQGYTDICVISFIDLYEKVKRNFPEAREVPHDTKTRLGKFFAETAGRHGMVLKPCAEGTEMAAYGADCGGCLTLAMFEQAIGEKLAVPAGIRGRTARFVSGTGPDEIPEKAKQAGCACHLSADIGAYNSCGHLCRYCYANSSAETVRRNMSAHCPESPLLTGWPGNGDRIVPAKQESWRTGQPLMFL